MGGGTGCNGCEYYNPDCGCQTSRIPDEEIWFKQAAATIESLRAEVQTSRTAVQFSDERVRVMEKQWHDAEALYYAEQKRSKKLENLCKLATDHRDALLFALQEANRYSNTLENLLRQFADVLAEQKVEGPKVRKSGECWGDCERPCCM